MTVGAPPTATPAAAAPRGRRWLLIGSLALNLLLVGAIAGSAFVHRRGMHEPVFAGAAMSPGEVFGFVRTLPPERRRAVREVMASERPRLQRLRASVDAARNALGAAMTVEPLDKATISTTTGALWTAEGDLRRAQFDALAEIASVLTLAERQKFVEWRKRRWKRPGGPGHSDADAVTEPAEAQAPSKPLR